MSCRQVEDHFKKRLGAFAKGFEASYARTPDQPPPQQVRQARHAVGNRPCNSDHLAAPCAQTVTLRFFTSRVESGLFRDSTQKLTWEEWKIPVRVERGSGPVPEAGERGAQNRARLSQALKERMLWILQQVDAKKDHLPELGKQSGKEVGVTYSYEVLHPEYNPATGRWRAAAEEEGSGGGIFGILGGGTGLLGGAV